MTGTTSAGWPDAVAVKLTTALLSPSFNWFQFGMLTKTRCSGVFGDMDPRGVDTFSQVTLLKTVKVNGVGPPAPTSMYRSWTGEKLSKVIVGDGQLYPCAHWLGLSPGLIYNRKLSIHKFFTGGEIDPLTRHPTSLLVRFSSHRLMPPFCFELEWSLASFKCKKQN